MNYRFFGFDYPFCIRELTINHDGLCYAHFTGAKNTMAHTLVLGRTLHGKSSYCKWLAAELHRAKVPVGVLTHKREAGWQCDILTTDPRILRGWGEIRRKKALFVDEARITLARDPQWDWFTTTARHSGGSTWIMAHRLENITPTLRGQCSELILFTCPLSDARTLADEWGQDRLLDAPKLEKLHFFAVGERTRAGRIAFDQGKPAIEFFD